MKRAIIGGGVACLLATALFFPQIVGWADNAKGTGLIWGQPVVTNNTASVDVSLKLAEEQSFDKASSVRIVFDLKDEKNEVPENAEFKFYSKGKNQLPVKETFYNKEDGCLTIILSGREDDTDLPSKEEAVSIGKLVVTADETVYVRAEGMAAGISGISLNSISEEELLGMNDFTLEIDSTEGSTPEESTPEESTPEESAPEESIPEESVPEESAPEESTPEETPSRPSNRPSTSNSSVKSEKKKIYKETTGTWNTENGKWRFKKPDGTYAADTWICVGQKWYYMGSDAYMKSGWLYYKNQWYYLADQTGEMVSGVVKTADGRSYYMNEDGVMQTGWIKINGKSYYFNPVQPTPVVTVDPVTGQKKETTAGQRPYGSMFVNETTPDGKRVDATGACMN